MRGEGRECEECETIEVDLVGIYLQPDRLSTDFKRTGAILNYYFKQ